MTYGSARQTTLGRLREGRRVNLEWSVRAADRLSGHVVREVVEGVGRVEERRRDGDATVITYSAPARSWRLPAGTPIFSTSSLETVSSSGESMQTRSALVGLIPIASAFGPRNPSPNTVTPCFSCPLECKGSHPCSLQEIKGCMQE